jgi:hypothetical protein
MVSFPYIDLWVHLMGTELAIFSDGLDVETCCELRKFCDSKGLVEIYGIGTHLTNGKISLLSLHYLTPLLNALDCGG